jgi:hypothetical protein
MKSRRNKMTKNKSRKHKSRKHKSWITALDAAQAALKKTGSLSKARMALRIQAAQNSRKLFGSVGKRP